MPRRSHRTLVAAIALALLAAPDVTAKPRPAPDYFPLRLGDWWKYRSTQANGATSEFTLTVVSEETRADRTVRKIVELTNPNPLIRDAYVKTPAQVLLVSEDYLGGGGNAAFEPPRPILELPLRPGASWRWSGRGRGGIRIDESSEVFASEKIETPAGRFDAVKIVSQIEQGGARSTKISWYARGVGLVRQSTSSGGVASTTDLVDYSFQRKR